MGKRVPHCFDCDRYFPIHGEKVTKHFCRENLHKQQLKFIHYFDVVTSPYWCPKRKA
jgi:hypothetical protein